jgi:hypothetical protein
VSDPDILGVSESYREYGVTNLSTATNFEKCAFVYMLLRILWPTKGSSVL